jgi:hypothetical protein
MAHFAVITVAAIMRAVIRCGRQPQRIRQVTLLIVSLEQVPAVHAGFDLRLGPGEDSHVVQGTRNCLKSRRFQTDRVPMDISQNMAWNSRQ